MRSPKPKTQQRKTPEKHQERDDFQTPAYATDLIAPYLAEKTVWECAAGGMRIVRQLVNCWNLKVQYTSLNTGQNFLDYQPGFHFDVIVTNLPYSLKQEFLKQCFQWQTPFALLMPAEWSGWMLDALEMGCQWLIPKRRIDYITPNALRVIYEKSTLGNFKANHRQWCKNFKVEKGRNVAFKDLSLEELEANAGLRYDTIDNAPSRILAKYSSSQFHSGWLTYGLKLHEYKQIIVPPLSLATKRDHVHE